MGLGGQASNSQSNNFQTGQSSGQSESNSNFGTNSASQSTGTSASNSRGQSTAQGFGFSGLSPTDSAGVSKSLADQITNQVFPALTSAANAQYNLPTLDSQGLYPAQEAAAQKATADALTAVSGRLAGNGQLQPDNINNVAGQAVQNVLPQLMPTISQNVQTAASAPINLAQARAASIAQLLSAFPGLLGSQNSQTSQSTQEANSLSNQLSEALTQTFGNSVSKSLQQAFSQGQGSSDSSSFGFGLGL